MNDAYTYHFRGFAYFLTGNFDLALADYAKALELKPDYVQVYYTRARTWLDRKEWEKTREDLTAAKDKGLDISILFRKGYDSVADFEQQNDVKLPEDIAAILTGQERISTPPMEENHFQPPCEIELRLFKDITEMFPEQEHALQLTTT
jgi:tetratricopeptide (TPR) repeat protein